MKSLDPKSTALLLIDVINDFAFPAGEILLENAMPAARCIHQLKQRFLAARIPVIYVNDNFGNWQSNFQDQIEKFRHKACRGHEVVELLKPSPEDYFILKPKHSAFYGSALEILLRHLGVKTLVLCGFAGDICVLYTANDAYMRDFQMVVPRDCVASESKDGNDTAMEHIRTRLKARVVVSTSIR